MGKCNNKYATSWGSKNGKGYIHCTICGREVVSNMGFEVRAEFKSYSCDMKMGLCHKCANKVRPIFDKAFNELNELRDMYHDNAMYLAHLRYIENPDLFNAMTAAIIGDFDYYMAEDL